MGAGQRAAAFAAVRVGQLETVRELLDADPGLLAARGDQEETLLHIAAQRDDVPIATELLEQGIEPGLRASWGYTAFEWAAAMAASGVAGLLLDRGVAELDLWTAAALGELAFVRSCFDGDSVRPGSGRAPVPGADLTGWPADAPYRTGDELSDAFHIAARNGHVKVAEFLLERGANVDAIGYFGATGLQWAAVAGREAAVRWLVDHGADPTRRDPKFDATAAQWASEGGHDALAGFLASRE